jgi:hypothetical protein
VSYDAQVESVKRVPAAIGRFFARLLKKVAVGVTGVLSLGVLLLVLDAVLLRDREARRRI